MTDLARAILSYTGLPVIADDQVQAISEQLGIAVPSRRPAPLGSNPTPRPAGQPSIHDMTIDERMEARAGFDANDNMAGPV